jgi:hypothetical protein
MLAGMALLVLAAPVSAGQLPDWMSGAWSQERGDRWADEYWTPARGGIMIGAGRNGRGEALLDWESMRIIRDGEGNIAFHGAPQGGPAVVFPMESQTVREIIFANPKHDFPQRIRYWREGALLRAEISKADGSSAMSWSYSPIGGQ